MQRTRDRAATATAEAVARLPGGKDHAITALVQLVGALEEFGKVHELLSFD